MNTVLFLGAGASVPLGLPTTSDFMDNLSILKLPSVYNDLVGYLHRAKKDSNPDIEEVLWELDDYKIFYEKWRDTESYKKDIHLERGNLVDKRGIQSYYSDVITCIDKIYKEVYNTYWQIKKDGDYDLYRQLYARFLGTRGVENIFTTNYDLVLETLFNAETLSDGFKPGNNNKIIKWDIKNYSEDKIKLYKLHGSIDWKKTPDNEVWRTPYHDFTRHEDNCLLYPGFKGIPKDEPFKILHSELEKKLMLANQCLAIGFSFRDKYINEIFQKVFSRSNAFKLIIMSRSIPSHEFPKDRVIEFKSTFDEGGVKKLIALLQMYK